MQHELKPTVGFEPTTIVRQEQLLSGILAK